jgi:hypothetical protein
MSEPLTITAIPDLEAPNMEQVQCALQLIANGKPDLIDENTLTAINKVLQVFLKLRPLSRIATPRL